MERQTRHGREQKEKKQNQSEVERWNRGNRLRNRVSKRTVSHKQRAAEYIPPCSLCFASQRNDGEEKINEEKWMFVRI